MNKKQIMFILVIILLSTQIVATPMSLPQLVVNEKNGSCAMLYSRDNLAENLKNDGWKIVQKEVYPNEILSKCEEFGYDYVGKIYNPEKEPSLVQKLINWLNKIFT